MPDDIEKIETEEQGLSSVNKKAVVNFKSVNRKGKYGEIERLTYVYRRVENENGKFDVVINQPFYKYIFEKLEKGNHNLIKTNPLKLILEIVDYNDNISSSKNCGISVKKNNDMYTIKADPKAFLEMENNINNDRTSFKTVTNHFIDMKNKRKSRTTKKTARKILKHLSSAPSLKELENKAPKEYSNFVKTIIDSTRIVNQSSLIQNGLENSLLIATKLCHLMLKSDIKGILSNNEYKEIIKLHSNAEKISERNWQNYILVFKELIFFDYVELVDEMEILPGDGKPKSRYDFFMIDEYNYPVIVELKTADVNIYVNDNSHNKMAFSAKVSASISQLMNYMDIFVKSFDDQENKKAQEIKEKIKGNRTIRGVLIVGGGDVNKNGTVTAYKESKEIWTQNNYLHNIKVITYKDIYNSLCSKQSLYSKASLPHAESE